MARAIDTAVNILEEVLESNHPNATVKTPNKFGECDFRIAHSVEKAVSVTAKQGYTLTDDDISEACERADAELSGYSFETEPEGDGVTIFTLKSS